MKRQIVRINFIYILSFLGDALFSPFLALYFSSINIEETKKGILLSLIPLAGIFGSLIYGKLSGNSKRNVLIIRVLVLMQLIVMVSIGFIKNYIAVLIFTIIFAMHNNTFFSFQDGVAVKISNQENTIYANTRFFGSLGYLIGTFIGGKLIDLTNYGIVFLIAGLIYVVVELMFFFIYPEEDQVKKEKITIKEIFKHREFILYLLFYVFALGTWNIGESYISLMFKNYGITTSQWGYIFSLEILVEMIVIFVLNHFIKRKVNYRIILFIAISLVFVRSFVLFLDINVWVKAFISAILRGLSWGLFLSSHMENLKKMLPNRLITKAVLILAICCNLFAFAGDFAAPYIYQNTSFEIMYLILSIGQVLGIVILIFATLYNHKHQNVKEVDLED